MRMPKKDVTHYQNNAHAAILVRIGDEVYKPRFLEIFRAIEGAVLGDQAAATDTLPLWIMFDSVDGSKFWYPAPLGFAPQGKAWLDGLFKAIPEASGYTRIRQFDFAVASGKIKRRPAPRASTTPRSPFVGLLPAGLEFMATLEAFAECQALAAAIRSAANVEEMDALMSSMSDRFPNLTRANLRLHGKLRKAMRVLVEHSALRLGSFDKFIANLRLGALHLLEADTDSMEIGVHRWYHNDDGGPRDMNRFLGEGQGHDVLIGAALSPVQDISDESTEYGALSSTVTVRWLDRSRWRGMGKTKLSEAVDEEEEAA